MVQPKFIHSKYPEGLLFQAQDCTYIFTGLLLSNWLMFYKLRRYSSCICLEYTICYYLFISRSANITSVWFYTDWIRIPRSCFWSAWSVACQHRWTSLGGWVSLTSGNIVKNIFFFSLYHKYIVEMLMYSVSTCICIYMHTCILTHVHVSVRYV